MIRTRILRKTLGLQCKLGTNRINWNTTVDSWGALKWFKTDAIYPAGYDQEGFYTPS